MNRIQALGRLTLLETMERKELRTFRTKYLQELDAVVNLVNHLYQEFAPEYKTELAHVNAAVTAPPAKPGASEECEPLKAALRNRKRFLCAP